MNLWNSLGSSRTQRWAIAVAAVAIAYALVTVSSTAWANNSANGTSPGTTPGTTPGTGPIATRSILDSSLDQLVSPPPDPQPQLAPRIPGIQDELIRITAFSDDPVQLLTDLEAIGLVNGSRFGLTVTGRLPLTAVSAMSEIDHLISARVENVSTRAGVTTSQGDSAHNVGSARSTFGLDGTGVTIGVISDSYDCLGGAQDDIDNGDLPAEGVTVYVEPDSCDGMTDEGRAMLQIIHDLAPGASLAFASGSNGEANLTRAIALLGRNVDVIVDDIGYLAEPYFKDGIAANTVNNTVEDGMIYLSAAGNNARQSYEDTYRAGPGFAAGAFPSTSAAPHFFGGTAHDFDPGPGVDWLQEITIPSGPVSIAFQWDDKFLSLFNGSYRGYLPAESELDIYLFDEAGSVVIGGSASLSMGVDPFESIQMVNTGAEITANLAIFYDGGPLPGRIKYIHHTPLGTNEFATESGTIVGHANAANAIAVGAVNYADTPAFGAGTPLLRPYSSSGGVEILRDSFGDPITPELRQKPAITAADGVNNSFFGDDDPETDGFPNFPGTSAAASHAAAITALLLEADPALSSAEVDAMLRSSAIDMGTPGLDLDSGSGFVDANLASSFVGSAWTLRRMPLLVNDMIMESNGQYVWVAVRGGHSEFENGILRIDTETGDIVAEWETTFEPAILALSDDGSVIYTGQSASNIVVRYSTATGDQDLAFSIGFDNTTALFPIDMEVMPNDPDVLVVAKAHPNSYPRGRGAAVYDDGVERPQIVPQRIDIGEIHFLPNNPSQMYGIGFGSRPDFWLLQVDTAGISEVDLRESVAGVPLDRIKDLNGDLIFVGGKILDSSTWPPTSPGVVPTIGVSEPDAGANRVYSINWNDDEYFTEIAIASLTSRQYIDRISIEFEGPPHRVEPSGIERWGDSGLAFFDRTEEGLFLFESHRTGPDTSSASFSDSALTFSSMVATGTDGSQARQLVMTNDGPSPVQAGNAQIIGPDWNQFKVTDDQCASGPIASGDSCIIEVTFDPEMVGNFTSTLAVSSNSLGSVHFFSLRGNGVDQVEPNSIVMLNLPANDIVYDSVSGSLFASSQAIDGDFADSVLEVDPATGLVIDSLEVGLQPEALAVSDDGTKLYLGLTGEGKIGRVDVPSWSNDFKIDLGTSGSPPVFVSPLDLEVVPGDASTVVASNRRGSGVTFEELAMFKDGVKLPDSIDTLGSPGTLAFSDDPGVLYGYDIRSTAWEFFRISVDSDGLEIIDTTGQLIREFFVDIEFDEGLVYSTSGRVVDPDALEVVGEFPGIEYPLLGASVRPVSEDGKAYFLINIGGDRSRDTWEDGAWEIGIFDIETFERIGTVPIGELDQTSRWGVIPSRLERWGSDGLAFSTNHGQFVLIRSDLIGDTELCGGLVATIVGTDGADIIRGTKADDVIAALGGNDTVYGGGGNDIICGGPGMDTLYGGEGDDFLNGGGDADDIFGSAGEDSAYGGSGDDRIFGGPENDFMSGGQGLDSLYGGDGGDTLEGGDDADLLIGGPGNDSAYGDEGDDRILGGGGDDFLSGGPGLDTLYGGDGKDTVEGGNDADTIFGGDGIDSAYGNEGDDRIFGGPDGDFISGGPGHDTLYGSEGADTIEGGDGNDTIFGGANSDIAYGGSGNDRIFGGFHSDTIYGDSGEDSLYGGDGNDTINGGEDADNIFSGDGEDSAFGDEGDDRIFGGPGDDFLSGGPGLDELFGQEGDDTIVQ